MPQFDFSNYSAQIFWFILCFIALYLFIGFVIIPRIKGVIKNRESIIGDDQANFAKLSKQISAIQQKSKDITRNADIEYKDFISSAVESSKEEREKSFNKFKESSEDLLLKSKAQIDKIISESDSKIEKIATDISDLIANKVLN